MNLPDGPFDLIYADPPLHFATWSDKGEGRSPNRHYATMTMPQLCELPIAEHAARDSILALWVYRPRLPDTLALIEAWGFGFRSIGLVWVKTTQAGRVHFGTGYYTRKASEILLLATRGKGLRRCDRAVRDVILAPRREHSRKPDEAAWALERLFGPVRRIELFARTVRPGWEAWGDQVSDCVKPTSLSHCLQPSLQFSNG
jgi:N6-adenosine-specific RNA methylase IME4